MNTRKCNKCGETKPLNKVNYYHTKSSTPEQGRFEAKCRICHNKHNKRNYDKWYRKTENVVLLNLKVKRICRKNKRKAIKYMGGRCVDCVKQGRDGVFLQCAYSFHHTDPTEKEHTISGLMQRKTWKSITDELDKCVLLCLNCHSIRHYTGKL